MNKNKIKIALLALVPAIAMTVVACGGDSGGTTSVDNTTYTIGGTVTGFAMDQQNMTLQNNGGDSKSINASGGFTFSAKVSPGTAYNVTVSQQADGSYCTVSNGSGTANANVTNVSVSCSTVGYSWTAVTSNTANNLYGVTYGNGRFVAVGASNGTDPTITTSTNGSTWAVVDGANIPNQAVDLNSVAYNGSNLFMAVGASGHYYTSSDGLTWTKPGPITVPSTPTLVKVIFGNDLFVAVAVMG